MTENIKCATLCPKDNHIERGKANCSFLANGARGSAHNGPNAHNPGRRYAARCMTCAPCSPIRTKFPGWPPVGKTSDLRSKRLDAPSQSGALSFGVTVLHPGQIDSEYYMTKGHYHVVRNTAEVYYTLSGEGVLVTENEDGQCILLPMAPGTASYVAPGFAHRMVNTGSQPLVSFMCSARMRVMIMQPLRSADFAAASWQTNMGVHA